jgi:hypothetical protein
VVVVELGDRANLRGGGVALDRVRQLRDNEDVAGDVAEVGDESVESRRPVVLPALAAAVRQGDV